ncbi:hypothetical protein KSP40_PGU000049 [Platanthera guangdongensis]|uniref:Uncharacterized protein n=1 Tax=Platanthera guangdongensis TaxID=2320717 RepID=A0ABR2LJS1_9ASPA
MKAFDAMKVEAKRVLASDGPLFGFSGERKEVEGGVGLHVTLGVQSRNFRFVIMDAPAATTPSSCNPLSSPSVASPRPSINASSLALRGFRSGSGVKPSWQRSDTSPPRTPSLGRREPRRWSGGWRR